MKRFLVLLLLCVSLTAFGQERFKASSVEVVNGTHAQQERATNRPPAGFESPQNVAIGGSSFILGRLLAANMNVTTDQAIIIWPGVKVVRRIVLHNCTATPTLAVGGFYTATSKGGTTIVANTQAYSSLTATTKYLDVTLGAILGTDTRAETTLYFSLTTAAGGASLCDIYVIGDPLP